MSIVKSYINCKGAKVLSKECKDLIKSYVGCMSVAYSKVEICNILNDIAKKDDFYITTRRCKDTII